MAKRVQASGHVMEHYFVMTSSNLIPSNAEL